MGYAFLVHRCLSDEASSFLCLKFRPNTSPGYIRTRQANKLHLPRPKMKYFRSTFTFQRALIHNHLPEIKQTLKPIRSFNMIIYWTNTFTLISAFFLSHQICITLYTTSFFYFHLPLITLSVLVYISGSVWKSANNISVKN